MTAEQKPIDLNQARQRLHGTPSEKALRHYLDHAHAQDIDPEAIQRQGKLHLELQFSEQMEKAHKLSSDDGPDAS